MLQVIPRQTIGFYKIEYFSYDGEKYTDHPNAIYDHQKTTLGNNENKVLAVGGYNPGTLSVELFDINSNVWTTKSPFPYCSSS